MSCSVLSHLQRICLDANIFEMMPRKTGGKKIVLVRVDMACVYMYIYYISELECILKYHIESLIRFDLNNNNDDKWYGRVIIVKQPTLLVSVYHCLSKMFRQGTFYSRYIKSRSLSSSLPSSCRDRPPNETHCNYTVNTQLNKIKQRFSLLTCTYRIVIYYTFHLIQ